MLALGLPLADGPVPAAFTEAKMLEISGICDYLDCQPGDILEFHRADGSERPRLSEAS